MNNMIARYHTLLEEEKELNQQIRKHLLLIGVRKLESGLVYCLNWARNKSSDSFALKTKNIQGELEALRLKLTDIERELDHLTNGTDLIPASPPSADKISPTECQTPPQKQTISPKRPKSPELELGADMGRLFSEVKVLDEEARLKKLLAEYPGKTLEEVEDAVIKEAKLSAAMKFERKQEIIEKANASLKM